MPSCTFFKIIFERLCFNERVTEEGSLPEIAQYDPHYLPLIIFTAFEGSTFYIYYLKHQYRIKSISKTPVDLKS